MQNNSLLNGRENLTALLDAYPFLADEFHRHGLENYTEPEVLQKIGRYLKLDTVCRTAGIQPESFLAVLNARIAAENAESPHGDLIKAQQNLDFISMLPCGLQMPFKNELEQFFGNNAERFKELRYISDGNVNHELSYYPHLDNVQDAGELPDIIIASDVNNFFHRPFMDRFIRKGVFEEYFPASPAPFLERFGFRDPARHFTMLGANMLVIIADKTQLKGRPVPHCWDDLLDPRFRDDIILRGDGDFFCNAVMLPFYKAGGADAVRKLARNIRTGLHPSQMVKLAGTGEKDGAAIYVMPLFFSTKIVNKEAVEVVFPDEGAIASPVFMLVKKNAAAKHKFLLDYLTSPRIAKLMNQRDCPSLLPGSENAFPGKNALWLGWDFLEKHDVGALKEEIARIILTERKS